MLIITVDDKIKGEELQYNINKKAEKISSLSSGRIDKWEYLTVKEKLAVDQSRVK